jgi:hypothetical protein
LTHSKLEKESEEKQEEILKFISFISTHDATYKIQEQFKRLEDKVKLS